VKEKDRSDLTTSTSASSQQALNNGAQPPSRRFLWLVLTPMAIVALILLSGAWLFWWPNRFDVPEKIVAISRGATFQAAVDSLVSDGVISNKRSFEYAGRFLGITKSIRVGRYHFKSGKSNLAILRDISEGLTNYPIPVRVGEGAKLRRVAGRFSRELGVDSTMFASLCTDAEFIKGLGLEEKSLEGYLLPDTYSFYWQTEERQIIKALVNSFRQFYVDSLKARHQKLGLTLKQVLALASIVEGETAIDSERAVVAGVYWNRLKTRMPLQADPTIQYIIPDGPRRLTYADLKVESPYNTYRHPGLPPGPISNPGRKSILAVLYPDKNKYFYFVANGSGGHKFSRTFVEHQRAVKNWRKIQREQTQQAQQAKSTAGG
jgi:UPF0755 protein